MTVVQSPLMASITSDHLQTTYNQLDRYLAKRFVMERMRAKQARQRMLSGKPHSWKPRLDVYDNPESTRITATLELPGCTEDDITVEIEGSEIFVKGERRSPFPSDLTLASKQYPIQEIRYGTYHRTIGISPGTLHSTIAIEMKNGLLYISWPRVPAKLPDRFRTIDRK